MEVTVRMRRTAAVTAVVAVLLAVLVIVVVRHVGDNLPLRLPAARGCTVDDGNGSPGASPPGDPVVLDVTQSANAATIAAVGLRRGLPRQAIVVALATAFQESKLENLEGGDRDSIGLFQQRPSQGWGKPEQLRDPRYAAGAFYNKLLKVKNWQKLRITDAAQAVQRSAHPEAYEKWAAKAQVLAKALTGEATGAVACTISDQPASRGPTAATNLVAGVKLDWGNAPAAEVTDLVGVALTVRTATAGWQYAHWLVAHADERGVMRVRFGDREWTAKSGAWQHVTGSDAPGTGEQVLAQVFGS
jgi:hypothetical protein